ncbi:MAG: sugar transferase [Christensenellales bacterium]
MVNQRSRPPHVLRRADPQALHRQLPQLINVLKGDMSIVGPAGNSAFRGAVPRRGAALHDPPYGQARHDRSAQVSGYAATLHPRTHRLRYRLRENWTIWLDIRIILHTFTSLVNDETLPPLHREK